jgi:hypothetical protein
MAGEGLLDGRHGSRLLVGSRTSHQVANDGDRGEASAHEDGLDVGGLGQTEGAGLAWSDAGWDAHIGGGR